VIANEYTFRSNTQSSEKSLLVFYVMLAFGLQPSRTENIKLNKK
jgi:hypothetical protein